MSSLLEPNRFTLGGIGEPKHYTPLIDDRIPVEDRAEKFGHWVSSYFQHGDTSAKNFDVLSWVEPSTIHPATVNNMSTAEKKEIIYRDKEVQYEIPYMRGSREQFAYAYRKVFLSDGVRLLFPGLKISFLATIKPKGVFFSYSMYAFRSLHIVT